MYCKEQISIIGLGYVGCPLAYLTASNGYNVIGIDNNFDIVDAVNKRINLPSQLENSMNLDEISLLATDKYEMIKNSKIIIICVPTPTKKNIPDVTILNNVINKISNFIMKGTLIIVESTLAPGMTRKYVERNLKIKNGLMVNVDYDLAYCPERIDPGNKKYWVGNINRVCAKLLESRGTPSFSQ